MKFPEEEKRNTKDVWYGVGLTVGTLVVFPAMIFAVALIKAFVLCQLWHWYIVKFFNQSELPLAIGFGIGLIISYLIPRRDYDKDKKLGEQVLFLILFPCFTLLLGWLGTFFI